MPPELACDDSYSYTYGDNESGTLFSASNPGGEVTVTVTGQTEAVMITLSSEMVRVTSYIMLLVTTLVRQLLLLMVQSQ